MHPHPLAPAALALLAVLLAAAATAAAETNTTTAATNTTTTATNTTTANATTTTSTTPAPSVTIPAVNVTQRVNVYVTARYVANDTIEVSWLCNYPLSPSQCPGTNVTVYAGGRTVARVYFAPGNASCGPGYCSDKATVRVNASSVVVEVCYAGSCRNETVARPSLLAGTPAGFLQALLPFAVAAGAAARGDLRLAGLGAIAAAVVIYLGQELGLWVADPLIVVFSVVAGVVALWLSR